jgi:hypothetical protein
MHRGPSFILLFVLLVHNRMASAATFIVAGGTGATGRELVSQLANAGNKVGPLLSSTPYLYDTCLPKGNRPHAS